MELKSRHDIGNTDDIKKLVNNFYTKVVADELLAPIFNDIVHTDWTLHLPKMYEFWETILFGGTYSQGNPVLRHVEVDKEESLQPEHFDRWLLLFFDTVDEYFTGIKAKEIKERAIRISEVIGNSLKVSRQRQGI